MSDPNQQQVICYNGVCRYKGIGDDPFAYDGEGNVVGVGSYGSLGTTNPPPTSGSTAGFGGSATTYYPSDPVPPAAVGNPAPPAIIHSAPPSASYVAMAEGFFTTDGELYETGWLTPSEIAQRNALGNTWASTGDVTTSDGYMSTLSGVSGTQLVARGFNANLPAEAAVVSIDVELAGRVISGEPEGDEIRFIYCGAETTVGGGSAPVGVYGPFSYTPTATGNPGGYGTVCTSGGKAAQIDWYDGYMYVWDKTSDTVDYIASGITFSLAYQANDQLYVIKHGTGEVYRYTPGTLTLIATLGDLGVAYDGIWDGVVNITVGGREQIVFLKYGVRIIFPTDTTASLATFTVPTDAATLSYYAGYNDKALYVNGGKTATYLFDPVSGANETRAAPPAIGSSYTQNVSFKLNGGEGYVAFLLTNAVDAATMYYSVIEYNVGADTWTTPNPPTDSTYNINPFPDQATSHLIDNVYHMFDANFLYTMPWKTVGAGSTTVLTPVNTPSFDEGRDMPDGGVYTCYTEVVRGFDATDLTLTPVVATYTGPAITRDFVNDGSFGVLYTPDITSGNTIGLDSVRINVRYMSTPSAKATPPALATANGYASVAFSHDGSEVVFGSVAGGIDYSLVNDAFATTPHTIVGGVGGRGIYDIVATPDGYVAVGEGGLVIVQDGIGGAFNVVKVGTTDNLTSVVYDPISGQVTIATASGDTLVSTDAASFTYIPSDLAEASYAMTLTPTAIVRVGANGSIYRSTDGGATWTTITSPTTEDLYAVHYDSLNLVAVGANGTIIYSSDNGLTWTLLTSGTTNDLYTVIGEANVFIAAGEGGGMLTSQNGGYTWAAADSGTTSDIRSGVSQGGSYYLVGDEFFVLSGSILSDLSIVSDADPVGVSDSFSVVVNYYDAIDESARDYGGFPEVLIENMQEEYGALVPNLTAIGSILSTVGENASLHEANFTNPHLLESSYKTTDAFSRTYGIMLLIQEAMDAGDSATAAALAFILTMAEQMSVSEDSIIGGTIIVELSDGAAIDDTTSMIAALRATLSEGLISGMLFGPSVGSPDPENNPEDDVWDCWVINTETRDTTTYNNFFFTSMAEVDGKVYTTDGASIYVLGGDTDAGAIIPAEIELPITDFGDSHLKNVNRVYLGMWADGKMALKTITEGNVERWYELEARREGVHEYRVPLPKGVKSRYWSFQIGNVMGGDFSLDSVTMLPVVLSRRVR